MKLTRRQKIELALKNYIAKPKYKVTLRTVAFNCPTSLSCESMFSVCYLHADNEEDLKNEVTKRFNGGIGQKEIVKYELVA